MYAEDLVGKVPSREIDLEIMESLDVREIDVPEEIEAMYVQICSKCKTYQRSSDIDAEGVCDKC